MAKAGRDGSSTTRPTAGGVPSAVVIKSAHLRVYVPDDESEGLPLVGSEQVVPFTGRYGIIGEPLTEDAFVAHWCGRRYVCPRTPKLRVLEGVLAIRRAYRQLGDAEVIPEAVARAARRELEALRIDRPDLRSHILTSAWHVPLRWFVPFDPFSKELVGDGRRSTIRYRVLHREGMQRLQRALRILSESGMPDGVATEVNELFSWLEGFPGEAMVELDYGSVADLFDDVELVMDESVAEVWASLEALESGNAEKAMDHYSSLISRWASPMAVTYSS